MTPDDKKMIDTFKNACTDLRPKVVVRIEARQLARLCELAEQSASKSPVPAKTDGK